MMNSKVLKYAGTLFGVVVLVVVIVVVVVLVEKSKGSSSSSANGTRVTDSLRFITVISRHGNRGAHVDYVTDPYPINDTKFWPYGSDQLTPQGRVEMYKLGKKIRSMYNGFLNSTTFNTAELHASSTYMDRMLISGEAFLAGLYPPQGFQVWNKDIPWQPTPLYSDSPDNTVKVTTVCPWFLHVNALLLLEFYKDNAAKYSEILDYYNNATGANATGYTGDPTVFNIWDKVISEVTEGYKVPDWLKKIYPEPMQTLMAAEYIQFYAATDEIVGLVVGNLFEEMLGVMESVMNGTLTERKIQYYSGHDSTIVAMQPLLGIPRSNVQSMVKPGSGMILELHQNSTTQLYTLQVLYIDGSSSDLEPVTLNIPYNDLPTIVNITQKYMGVNFDQQCQSTNYSSLSLQRY